MSDLIESTYLILELPLSPLTEAIMDIRRRYEPWRAEIPVEITVVGSSGIGVFKGKSQNLRLISDAIDALASRQAPIPLTFKGVTHFPGTQIHYLEPENEQVFRDIQNQLIQSGLEFEESPFPFTPHCTIANFQENLSPALQEELLQLPFREQSFTLTKLTLYTFSANMNERLASFPLRA